MSVDDDSLYGRPFKIEPSSWRGLTGSKGGSMKPEDQAEQSNYCSSAPQERSCFELQRALFSENEKLKNEIHNLRSAYDSCIATKDAQILDLQRNVKRIEEMNKNLDTNGKQLFLSRNNIQSELQKTQEMLFARNLSIKALTDELNRANQTFNCIQGVLGDRPIYNQPAETLDAQSFQP